MIGEDEIETAAVGAEAEGDAMGREGAMAGVAGRGGMRLLLDLLLWAEPAVGAKRRRPEDPRHLENPREKDGRVGSVSLGHRSSLTPDQTEL
jgi:hypothetical protein